MSPKSQALVEWWTCCLGMLGWLVAGVRGTLHPFRARWQLDPVGTGSGALAEPSMGQAGDVLVGENPCMGQAGMLLPGASVPPWLCRA